MTTQEGMTYIFTNALGIVISQGTRLEYLSLYGTTDLDTIQRCVRIDTATRGKITRTETEKS